MMMMTGQASELSISNSYKLQNYSLVHSFNWMISTLDRLKEISLLLLKLPWDEEDEEQEEKHWLTARQAGRDTIIVTVNGLVKILAFFVS